MSLKLVSNKEYVAGWFDVSIHHFLENLSRDAAGISFALITHLDSNPDPASLLGKSPELKSIAKRAKPLGRGLLLPTRVLLETEAQSQIFYGFDEVWFFPHKTIQPKPESASIVGPARIDRARFKKLGRWMSRNQVSMAVGGGEGLNFVVRAHGPARYLLEYSIEQPEPYLASQGLAASG